MSLHLETGTVPVAGYSLVRMLGRGGFGEVWEALAPGRVRVALKFIRLDTEQAGPEQRALEIIRDIRHPHLLDVQFAARVDDCLVIAMPLCDESLMDRLRACQAEGLPGVPRDELLGYMNEVARAIDFLNQPRHPAGDGRLVGVQHRDIKPHNIFLVGGSARVADFGLAKILESSSASHTGAMSANYVAPEVLQGVVSQYSDQYSLAAAYAHLRTGKHSFAGGSVNQVLYAHAYGEPDLEGLPEQEQRVVARALEKQPESALALVPLFVTALEEAIAADGPRATPREAILAQAGRGRPGRASAAEGVTKMTQAARPGRSELLSTLPDAPPSVWRPPAVSYWDGPRAIAVVTVVVAFLILTALILYPRFARRMKGGLDQAGGSPARGAKEQARNDFAGSRLPRERVAGAESRAPRHRETGLRP